MTEHPNASDRFELLAELFLKDTGMLAPGKDQSPLDPDHHSHVEREEAWAKWNEEIIGTIVPRLLDMVIAHREEIVDLQEEVDAHGTNHATFREDLHKAIVGLRDIERSL